MRSGGLRRFNLTARRQISRGTGRSNGWWIGTLILQQAALQPEDAVTDAELDAQLATLRKDIPACKQYHCETDAGWQKYRG